MRGLELLEKLETMQYGVYLHANQVSFMETFILNMIVKYFVLDPFISFILPGTLTGFGIDQLRDDCMDTYWQSDGQLPHLVNIQFQRKTMVSHIYIYTDYKLDESYTPSRISIRAGTHFNDLQEIEVIELIEPSGKDLFC